MVAPNLFCFSYDILTGCLDVERWEEGQMGYATGPPFKYFLKTFK